MDFKELKELRSEINLGSCFISDYENSLGYTPESVCDFFDGYVEHIEMLIEEGGVDYGDFDKYDNDETLQDYFCSIENVDNCFIKADADYIADKYHDGYVIEETTHNAGDGEMQPCINVYRRDDPDEMLTRFVPYYHLTGPTTVLMKTFFGDELNDEEELMHLWDDFSKDDALRFVKREVYY